MGRMDKRGDQAKPHDSHSKIGLQEHVVSKLESNPHNFNELFKSIKNLEPTAQLKLWKNIIDSHPFDLNQLRTLRTAIDERIKLDIISKVPYEIALYILSFLSPEDLCQASQTCRSWRTVCDDNRLWRDKCKEEGLLDDEQTLDTLFKKQITDSDKRWKVAYLKHMSILRDWTTRNFQISEPLNFNEDQSKTRYLMQLRCHEDSVITCLQYNPRTNTIVSGSDDQTLKVWSSETGRCLTTLEGHTGGVWTSQLSAGDIVVSGSTDRTLKVWNAHTGKLLHTLYGHTSTVRCLALNGDRVVSGSRDTTLRLWDINKGICVQVFVGHTAAVRCVEFKNNTIVSGAYDNLVMIWDALTGNCCHVLDGHSDKIYSLQFDGRTIASGSLDTTIGIWDVATGKLRHRLEGHTSLTSKMQLKDHLLVSANADKLCKVWNINTGECLYTLEGENMHTSAITSVYFNNRHIVTSSDDGTVKLWDIKNGQFIKNLVVLPTAAKGGVIWRFRATYTKLICAAGHRIEPGGQIEDTHLLVLDFNK